MHLTLYALLPCLREPVQRLPRNKQLQLGPTLTVTDSQQQCCTDLAAPNRLPVSQAGVRLGICQVYAASLSLLNCPLASTTAGAGQGTPHLSLLALLASLLMSLVGEELCWLRLKPVVGSLIPERHFCFLSACRAGAWDQKFADGIKFTGDPVVSTPDVTELVLTEDDEFLIVASDGLW